MKKVFTLIAALVFAVAAMAETINVESHDVTKKQGTDEGGNWVQYIFNSEIGKFYFCFYAEGEATDIVAGTTYALADMDAEYCAYVISSSEYYDYSVASFTKTDEDNFTASVTCTDGNTYNITVAPIQPITEPKDTVLITINDKKTCRVEDGTQSTSYDPYVDIKGFDANHEYYLYLSVLTTNLTGTFTDDDVDRDYTYLVHIVGTDTTAIEFYNLLPNAVFSGTASAFNATVNYVGADSVLYQITFNYVDPVATTPKTFNATDLTFSQNSYYDVYALYYSIYAYDFMATNTEEILYGTTYSENDNSYGTYNIADGYIGFGIYDATTKIMDTQSFSGTITIAKNGTATSLSGTSICYGDIEYTFNVTGDATAVENVEASDINVYNEGRVVVLNGAEGMNAAIYDIAGRMVNNTMVNSDNARFELPVAGVYVVRVNGQSFRVVVK